MNKSRLLATACVSAGLLFSATASAQSPGPKARLFAKYDTNKNGVIDGEEIAVVRKAFAADLKGEFATYDADHDGKLSDAEIASIKPPGAKKDGEKKGGGKKKADAETKTEPEKKSDAK
jgi:Ca2+-binding EF-hand superfamily protein